MQKNAVAALVLMSILLGTGLTNITPALADSGGISKEFNTGSNVQGNTGSNGTATLQIDKSQVKPVVYNYNFPRALKTILSESNGQVELQIEKLQEKHIAIPADANSTYSEGLIEYEASLKALDAGDYSTAKIHAFNAMPLFRSATLVLIQEEENHSVDNILANAINEITYEILDSVDYAAKLRTLAITNNVTVSFTDYDRAINASKTSLASGDLTAAKHQLTTAEGLLDNIHTQIQTEADSKKGERAKEFVINTIKEINKAIDNAKKLGLPQSIIDQLQSTIDSLQNTTNIDDILNGFDQFSYLQKTIDAYNNGRIQNFDKESINIQNNISILQSDATKIGIHLDVTSINDLIVDIKQKIVAGQSLEALDELDQIDYQINDLKDLVDGSLSVLNDISQTRELISSLEAEVHQQNNTAVINQIPIAIVLLDYAHSLIVNGSSSSFNLDTAVEAVDHAKNILNDVSDSLNTVKERFDSIMNDISQLTDQANSLKDTATQQNNTNALAEIDISLKLISQAKDFASHWNLSDAEARLGDAQGHLDTANHWADLLNSISQLTDQANSLKDTATQQNNTNALAEIDISLKLISQAKDFASHGDISSAESKLTDVQGHLDKANEMVILANANELKTRADELEIKANTLVVNATNQKNTAAITLIHNATISITESRDLLAKGDYDQAYEKISYASDTLDTAYGLIEAVDQIMAHVEDLANQIKTLESEAKNQNNVKALEELNQATSLIDNASTIALQGEIDQANSDLEQAQIHLDAASSMLNAAGANPGVTGSNVGNGTAPAPSQNGTAPAPSQNGTAPAPSQNGTG